MLREEFRIGRLDDSADLNLNVCCAKFRAEVENMDSTAFQSHASRYVDREFWNRHPVLSMLDAVRLNRIVGRCWQKSATGNAHRGVACFEFRVTNCFVSDFDFKSHRVCWNTPKELS
jgi:hypothetical protein